MQFIFVGIPEIKKRILLHFQLEKMNTIILVLLGYYNNVY